MKQDFDPDSHLWNAGYRRVTLDLRGVALAARPLVTAGDVTGEALIKDATAVAAENWTRFSHRVGPGDAGGVGTITLTS